MTEVAPCLDFNDAPEQNEAASRLDTDTLRRGLRDRLEAALAYLFPKGRIQGNRFTVGDVEGHAGKSLVVELKGGRRGLWIDFDTRLISTPMRAAMRSNCGPARAAYPPVMTFHDWQRKSRSGWGMHRQRFPPHRPISHRHRSVRPATSWVTIPLNGITGASRVR